MWYFLQKSLDTLTTCFFLADPWGNEKEPPAGKLTLEIREWKSDGSNMTLSSHLPLLPGRKLASSTSSMQSSCTWRRHPLNTCSGASTCPTRMLESA
jgi:hypothetical protein